MIIIGLTGSLASGKSTVAGWLAERQIAVHDADSVVRGLLTARGQAVSEVVAKFGKSFVAVDGGIDRKKLGDYVFFYPKARQILESILHPLVQKHRDNFLDFHRRLDSDVVVLDVPLLFETGGDALCDYVVLVHAADETIRKRAEKRHGMTKEKVVHILKSQMTVAEKSQRADFILNTDLEPKETRQLLFSWLDDLPLVSERLGGDNNA